MSWIIVALVAAVALIAALPFWVEARRPKVGRADRAGAEGRYIKLSKGVTRYRWSGAARGKTLVAVHGLTTPSSIFDRLAPLLGALGYRVLSYDLYGRGLSDAVEGPQDEAFFLDQLEELLGALKIEGPITLLGYSMGGAIVTAFAQADHSRVERLILLAPAGLGIVLSRFESACVRLPGLGDWLLLAASLRPATSRGLAPLCRGFLPGVLSSLRNILQSDQSDAHRQISREDVPVIAIWAGQDERIPLQGLGRLAQASRNARQVVIDSADHTLPLSAAPEVAEAIAGIIREGD